MALLLERAGCPKIRPGILVRSVVGRSLNS